jgi:peptide/nickel transport system substrate-binding protein
MKRTFKTFQWLAVLLLAALLTTQCAPQATALPEQTATEAPAQPAATEAPAQPAATEAPTEPAATEAPTQPTSEEVARSEVFVYAHPTTFPDLNPATSYSNDLVVMANCYETLTYYNAPGSSDVLSPKLATSWESNADSTEWTFKLREGVTFQDGEPFNAEAVKYSIEKIKELAVGASYIWDAVSEIQVVDDYTIKFALSYAAPLDLVASASYSAWIFSPKAYEEHGADWFNEGHCAGTGPYTIESYERGARLVMTRFDDYWGGWKAGQFKKVVFELIEDPVVLQQKIESGEADFTYSVAPDNLPALEARSDLKVYRNPSFVNLLGLYNTVKPPLDNPMVREALSYSFPYDQLMQGVMTDRATQAYGPVPVEMWGSSKDLPQYHQDLDKAKQLLSDAGYPDGGFKLLYTFATGDMDEQQVGELWKADLAKLGIDLEIQGLNWEAQWDLGKSDPQKAQDIFVMYWWPDLISPYSFLYSMFHSEDETLFNLAYYKNPEFDDMIDQANEITGADREKATQMFIDAQKILIDQAVAIFFYDVADIHIARADVKGYVDNPAYPHVAFVYQMSR